MRRTEGRSRLGITGRLVVLVLLPVSLLAAAASPNVVSAAENSAVAHRIDRNEPSISDDLTALAAAETEQAYADSIGYGVPYHLSAAQISSFLGIDLSRDFRAAQAATDSAVAVLDPGLRPLASALPVARRGVEDGRETGAAVDAVYQRFETALNTAVSQLLRSAANDVSQASDTQRVAASLATLQWTQSLVAASVRQSSSLVQALVGPSQERGKAKGQLAAGLALEDEAGRHLAASGFASISSAWDRLQSDGLLQKRRVILLQTVDGTGPQMVADHAGNANIPSAAALEELATVLRGGVQHWLRIDQVVRAATAGATATATTLAVGARRVFMLWLWVTLLAIAATALVTTVISRSISRPLARIAEAARAVVDGRLDIDGPSDRHGPRETAVVAGAFNSLITNLRLLEAKAQALAACDFENPALEVPLPGRLGQSLQDSVKVLSGSVQERHALQERLAHQATHDGLTGLLNRAAAMAAIDQALARCRRSGDLVAVLYIDLDHFKRANDLHGHQSGDKVLREVARRLRSIARDGDVVARLGGDEFIVAAERIGGAVPAETLAIRLLEELARPLHAGERELEISASIGVAVVPAVEVDASDLIARADIALYDAKGAGGRRVSVYDRHMQEKVVANTSVERDLREELARGGPGLVLHYQPIVDGITRQVRSVEALLRWRRSDGRMAAPQEFIPVAETSDLIVRLDEWVLDRAVRQLAEWSRRPGTEGLSVSVNVSGRHLLTGQLADRVAEILERHGAPPSQLVVEITETVLVSDMGTASAELNRLREMGIRVAIDDFGTGYTTLAHLHHLTVDTLKIDRMFITDLDHPRDQSLIRMITDLAHHIGATIVTEGVETSQQLRAIQDLGCDQVQGYLIARPMDADALATWLAQRSPGPSAQVAPGAGAGDWI